MAIMMAHRASMLSKLLLLLCTFHIVNPAKIGIFTAALSKSQIMFNIRIAESLTKDGHEVVLIRPEYNPQSTELKSKNPKIREIHTKAAPLEVFRNYAEITRREIFEGLSFFEYFELSNAYRNLTLEACKGMLANDVFLDSIRKEKIELAYHHHIDFCQHGIAHHLGIKKWVYTMPGPAHSLILHDLGIPHFDSYMPNLLQNSTTDMNFIERVKAITGNLLFKLMAPYTLDIQMTKLLRDKFGQDLMHISELRKTAALAFINNDPFLEYPYPHTQKVQFIGGIGTTGAKPLVEPFLSFAEKVKKIVLISFGSVAVSSEMPQIWKETFVELFKKNPDISFIWKFEEDITLPKNVLRTKWIPQNDLLALNKTVAFITHGGYNSLGEAVQSGTPCVFIPLFADQFRNSMLAQYKGIGIQQPKLELDFDSLNSKLHEILNNPRYLEKVKMYQSLHKGQLNSADQILRHWTRLILAHPELDLSLPRLSSFKLYNWDVYFLYIVVVVTIFLLLRTLFRWYYWSCCEMAYKEKEKIQ